MTGFSPGLVLGCFELLEMVDRRQIKFGNVVWEFPKIGVMQSNKVVDLVQTLNWVHSGDDGYAIVTREGKRILSCRSHDSRVRQALLDYVDIVRPPWLQNASFGRSKVLSFASSDIVQTFVEVGLASGTDPEVVTFWDELAARARGQKGYRLTSIGRRGERLTIEYEKMRTGQHPKWVSIDDNSDGYDVLSVVGLVDKQPLLIEVKATTAGLKENFHLTANEWELAKNVDNHVFHFWDLSASNPTLAVLCIDDVGSHVPIDNGEGRWESVRIPFETFAEQFVPQSSLNY
jgi:hypothetical protein